MRSAWPRPGPVSEAVEGPFAEAGAVAASAASVPRVASTRSLRMGGSFLSTPLTSVHRPSRRGSRDDGASRFAEIYLGAGEGNTKISPTSGEGLAATIGRWGASYEA